MRLLTVTADHHLAAGIAKSVAGRATSHHEHGAADAIRMALPEEFDALVVDRALPGITGLEVVRRIRAKGSSMPILMMLDENVAATRTEAFLAGVDDVMPKSFDGAELAVRIETLVRRCHGHSKSSVMVGAMLLDFDRRFVSVNGRVVDLTAREFDVIGLLVLRLGKVLSKQHFLNHLYGGLDEPEGKIVDVFICKVRKKLAEIGAGDLITTVRGKGYVMHEPAARFPAPRLPAPRLEGSGMEGPGMEGCGVAS